MKLTQKQYLILKARELDPFKPLAQVAKELKMTWTTVNKHYTDLIDRGVIDTPSAVYDHMVLGLQRVVVMCHCSSLAKLIMLETACNEHPYIHYRARALGGRFGLFIQFDCPINIIQLIKDFFYELTSMDIVLEFEMYESTGLRTSLNPDLSRFDSESSTWNFSWEKWFSDIDSYSQAPITPTPVASDFSEFRPSYFQILKLLTENPSFSQTQISEKLSLSKTETHRQYTFVRDHYINSFRLRYKRELFNINETYVVLAKSCNPALLNQIFNGMNDNPPPFNLSLDIMKEKGLQIWASMSTNQAISLSYSLWEHIENCQIHILNTRSPFSWMYWFYPPNFDFENMKWRDDWEYVVGIPLNLLIKKFDNLKI